MHNAYRVAVLGSSLAAACATQAIPPARPIMTVTSPSELARAIRRDIPMTNMIRRAHAAGTRDSTGRPGRNYWQQWVEYAINARLDVPTSTITGRETITLRNNSDSALRVVYLRLDQNFFSPIATRLESPASDFEVTQGMKITRATVNGQAVNLNRGAPPPVLRNGDQTIASVALQNGISAKGNATIEIDWNFKVPNVVSGRGERMGRLADTLYQVAQWY